MTRFAVSATALAFATHVDGRRGGHQPQGPFGERPAPAGRGGGDQFRQHRWRWPRPFIDGDPATPWGEAFSPEGTGTEVDFGRRVSVGTVELHWEWGGARVLPPELQRRLLVAHRLRDPRWRGRHREYDVFPTVQARYLRLANPRPLGGLGRVGIRFNFSW